jgi:hypothetical protein
MRIAENARNLGKWWAHKNGTDLPDAIRYKANYVIYPAELAEYELMLFELQALVTHEHTRVRRQIKLMERGSHLIFDEPETPYTVGRALSFLVDKQKVHLKIMQWLTACAKRRVEKFRSLGDSNEQTKHEGQ